MAHVLVASLVLLAAVPAALAQPRYAESEQWYNVTDDGHRQYVYEMGRAVAPGDTVVVLHGGWGADHSYLLDPLAPLADRRRFVLYDQRGSLHSPAPDSMITLDRLVADLDDLRQALGLRRMTLVGHSMGAALAYAYLARHPEHVRGLVLVGAVLPAMLTNGPNMAFIREVWPDADSTALVAATQAFVDDMTARTIATMRREGLVPDSLRDVPPSELNLLGVLTDRAWTRAWRIAFTAANTCSGDNWREMQGGMVFYRQEAANAILRDPRYAERTDAFWPALRRFDGPVRVVMGTCDYVDLGPAVWPYVVSQLPDGSLFVVERAGHSLWMDRPEAFREALAAALADATR